MNDKKNLAPCDFCGKLVRYGAITPYHGFYCQSCIRMSRDYEIEALKEIREEIKRDKTREEAEKALKERGNNG